MSKIMFPIKLLVYPLYFIVTFLIEYPMWKTYKKEGYNVPCYIKFNFGMMTKFTTYTKHPNK